MLAIRACANLSDNTDGKKNVSASAREDLERVLAILFSEFDDAIALATQHWKRNGRILKVLLFGAHARVEGSVPLPGGRSPKYSILVVVSDDRFANQPAYWAVAAERMQREYDLLGRLAAPVSLTVQRIKAVHADLKGNRSFLCDALLEGIMLYELPGHPLEYPRTGDRAVVRQEHSEYWYASACEFLELARIALGRGWLNRAVFQYHQATEVLYHVAGRIELFHSEVRQIEERRLERG